MSVWLDKGWHNLCCLDNHFRILNRPRKDNYFDILECWMDSETDSGNNMNFTTMISR